MLSTVAVYLLSPVLVLSLHKLSVAFRARGEAEAQRAVRWATIALGLSLCVALAEGAMVYARRPDEQPGMDGLWAGLRAAKDLCAPPIGVSAAMLYLARTLRTAVTGHAR